MCFLGLQHILHSTTPYKQDIHRKKSLFHPQVIGLQTLLVHDDNQMENIFIVYPYQCHLSSNQLVLTDFSLTFYILQQQKIGWDVNFLVLLVFFKQKATSVMQHFLFFLIPPCNCQSYVIFCKYKIATE